MRKAKWPAACMAVLLALLVMGCENDLNSVAVESVTLDKTTLTLAPGKTGKLTATVTPSNASDKTVGWSSSNTEIVMVDSNGTVLAIKAGIATITAQVGGKTAICLVTVKQESVAVESVTLDRTTLTLALDGTKRLTATVTPGNADDKRVEWSSSNTEIVMVDSNGTVLAIKVGTATITAKAGGKEAACAVTVKPILIAVESVALDMTTLTLASGKTRRLTATVLPGNADDKAVAWSSSNADVATVGTDGTVTAHAEGMATITARAGDKEAACEVTVKPILIAVREVYLTKETMLYPGQTWPLTLVVLPNNADDKAVTWSSSNADIVTVDDDGIITAVKPGTATVTVTTREGGKTAACTVTVGVMVERVTLNTDTLSLAPGEAGKLTATVMPDDATHKPVFWRTSDESVATVDDDGIVTAVKPGTATVTVTTWEGYKTAACTVTVGVMVERVTLNTDTLSLAPGEAEKLTATVTPDNADDKTVAWSSSDEAVATVDDDGTVTAHKAGSATITATAQTGGKTAECTVTVSPIFVEVERVTLNTTMLTLTRGETGKLTATVMPSNADDTRVTWSSSDGTVATVGSDGTVTAVKAGTAIITAQAGNRTATCTVTVNPILIAVDNITLDKGTLTLTRGGTERLTATVTPDNASDKTVTWSSSDTSVATVNNYGSVSAVKVGTATITAKAGGKTATCVVTVNPILVESVTLEITAVTLELGMTRKLTATINPDNADDKTVKWSSSDTSVATVDKDGTVTAVKVGTATITAQAGDKQAICMVTVKPQTIAVTSISLNWKSIDISPGDRTFLSATVKPSNADDKTVKWSSSDTSVATVDKDGTVVAVKVGTATITARAGDKQATCKVTVHDCSYSGGKCTICGGKPYMANGTIDDTGVLTKYSGKETTVVIPEGVTSIGGSVFSGYTSLTGVTIPNSVTSIGVNAFKGCTSLSEVTIPNSVTTIGWSAFHGCTNLTNVKISNKLTSIEDYMFLCCEKLTDITIPDSVTSIGSQAFSWCTNLTSVKIGNGVTSIERLAFYDCKGLMSVMIGNSVTNIGQEAFGECTSLTTVNYNGTEEEWKKINRYKGDDADGLSGKKIIGKDDYTWTAQ